MDSGLERVIACLPEVIWRRRSNAMAIYRSNAMASQVSERKLQFGNGPMVKGPIRGGAAMFRTLSLSLLLACSCGLANAQDADIRVRKGGVTGTLTNFSGNPEDGTSVEVFTVPEGTAFALTTACVFGEPEEGEVPVLTTDSGPFITEGDGCVNYSPGLIVTEGVTIICQAGEDVTTTCQGVGILVRLP
jgi:hypothetical protein